VKNTLYRVLSKLERQETIQLLNGNAFKSPDPRTIKGNIFIGTVVGNNAPAALTFRHFNENAGLWGRAGSGKTNLCQLLCLQLVQAGISVRCLDYKIEYRDLLPHIPNMLVLNPKLDKFNPLQPIGNPAEWLQFLADTLQQDFNLKPETKFMWLNYADELYKKYDIYGKGRLYPSIKNMQEFLIEEAGKKTTTAAKRRKIYTCLEVINSLLISIGDMLDCSSGYTESALSDYGFVSYEMSNLSSNIQSFISKFRLKSLYHKCLSSPERHKLKIVAIIEEAKMLLSQDLHKSSTSIDYIKQLLTQARSSGFGAIITDQNKNQLADFVINNLSCQICFNLASPREIRSTAYSMGCNEEQIRQILYLKIPNAIVSMPGCPPFLVRVPKNPVTRHIEDRELLKIMQPRLASLQFNPKQEPQREKIQVIEGQKDKDQKQTLHSYLKSLRDFLTQLQQSPESNITQLYSSLNLSGRKGDKIKGQLLSIELIEEEIIYTGKRKRPSKRLKLNEKGERVLQWLEQRVKAD
ncbi:MAG: hypothetical protein QG610_802, partial [Euryarchaeota archaeon]|nr:hypothetical protein [Euryarchaeota archaeon]